MKTKIALTVLASAVFLGTAAFATPSTPAPIATADLPVPVKVVQPTDLPRSFTEATVELTFTIDEAGNVHDVAPVSRIDKKVAQRLLPAVAQWKFTPMVEDGRPVPVRVIFPLKLSARA